jgi:sugar phosphate isomerase/epimerase
VTVHLKPHSATNPQALIGEDDIPWPELFAVCESSGGTEWYIVEYEVPGIPPLEAVDRCLQALRGMGK